MALEIACIGGANVDWVTTTAFASFPIENTQYEFKRNVGGVAVNIASRLAAQGHRPAIFSVIGNDDLGSYIQDTLSRKGLRLHLLKANGPTSKVIQIYGQSGLQLASYCHTEISDALNSDDIAPWINALVAYKIWILDTDLPKKIIEELTQQAPQNTKIFITLVSLEKASRLPHNLGRVSGIFMNLQELRVFYKEDIRNEADIQNACKDFFARGCAHVFITDGPQGAWAVTEHEVLFEKAVAIDAPVLSANGAGDAFMTGVTNALLTNQSLQTSLTSGLICANDHLRKINLC